jgi:hypothetical protein
MDVSPQVQASKYPAGAADWATIGRRIMRAAAMAAAIRVIEVKDPGGTAGSQEQISVGQPYSQSK